MIFCTFHNSTLQQQSSEEVGNFTNSMCWKFLQVIKYNLRWVLCELLRNRSTELNVMVIGESNFYYWLKWMYNKISSSSFWFFLMYWIESFDIHFLDIDTIWYIDIWIFSIFWSTTNTNPLFLTQIRVIELDP